MTRGRLDLDQGPVRRRQREGEIAQIGEEGPWPEKYSDTVRIGILPRPSGLTP